MLKQRGADIVDDAGQPLLLRGVGLGGWMNMENFITGYPGNEEGWRRALLGVLGPDRYHLFFEKFLEYFFGEEDARFLASLGLNAVRVPINYRHLESDEEPFTIHEAGFRHLDRVIDTCARHGIFTIIDLHAAQGYQSQAWHCDNPTHVAFLWTQKMFQDRVVNLWEAIADRYRGNPWVAGYNLINEPNDPEGSALLKLTRRLYDAVLAVDPDHLIFIDGNGYGSDLSTYPEPWPGVVYDIHDYAMCGFTNGGPYPGYTRDVYCDAAWLERHFLKKGGHMRVAGAPIWVGEFGPLYIGDPEAVATRVRLTRDQIDLFERYNTGWSIWTYKDIGLEGVVYLSPNSPYMRRLAPALEKKARLGVDEWGATDEGIREIMEPIERRFEHEFPGRKTREWDPQWHWIRLVRTILFAEALLPEFADCFRDLDEDGIDTLMQSFKFENCTPREGLVQVLAGEA